MHASIGGVGVIYPDTSFVDNRDTDKLNPTLLNFPDTVDGPALPTPSEFYKLKQKNNLFSKKLSCLLKLVLLQMES